MKRDITSQIKQIKKTTKKINKIKKKSIKKNSIRIAQKRKIYKIHKTQNKIIKQIIKLTIIIL